MNSPERLGNEAPENFCRDLGHTILFFKNLRRSLISEVEMTNACQSNPNLHIEIITNDEQFKESATKGGENLFSSRRIELTNSKSSICAVVLVIASPHIEVLLGEGNIRKRGEMMVFVVEDSSGTKAHKMDLEPLPYALHEMTVKEIAKGIVAGAVGGGFD
jgi:hypothetical protein